MRRHLPLAAILLSSLASLPARADAPPSTALDLPKVKTMLENMGYTVDSMSNGWQISEKRNGTTVFISFSIAGDGSEIWLKSFIGYFDPATIPQSVLVQMLKDNSTWSPEHFALTLVGNQYGLYVNCAIDNHDITPKLLRSSIDYQVSAIVATINTWDHTKWPTTAPATAPAATK